MSANNSNNDDIELVELKRKHFRQSKKSKNVTSSLLHDDGGEQVIFLNDNKKLDDSSCDINNLNNTKFKSKKMSNKKKNFLDRLDNILDLNLKFDSTELENAFKTSYISVNRSIYIKYLLYLIIFTLTWFIYLTLQTHLDLNLNPNNNITLFYTNQSIIENNNNNKSHFLIAYLILIFLIYLGIFIFLILSEFKENEFRKIENKLSRQELETKVNFKLAEKDLKLAMKDVLDKEHDYKNLREKHEKDFVLINKMRQIHKKSSYPLAIFIMALMFLFCFTCFFLNQNVSQTTHFVWFIETILLLYLIYPFQLLIPITIGVLMSFLFEFLTIQNQFKTSQESNSIYLQSQIIIFIFIKVLIHTCLHLISIYLKLSLDSIKRDNFMKLAHMNKAHMASQQDKQITERMIKSIMPPLFTHVFGKPEQFKKSVNRVDQMRPLFIYPVSEISILFADIVGFTKMSSTKTAEELVYLLNDLYGRFDKLCEQAGCEKISTLGDCYYCVSGCLNGRLDHAKCCVEMGLLMVKEIEIFNKDHSVDVNMRVGVHTGSALCGFIGGKRFRFDVWSSDVTLANKMESSGRPGWVHISEDTFKKLDGKFNTEPGEKYTGKNTYFVIRESKRETVADALKLSESLNNKKSSEEMIHELEVSKQSLIKIEQNMNTLNEQDQLLLAVKDLQIFQPDINLLTMRFTNREEKKFHGFVLGVNQENNFKRKLWNTPRNFLFISILITFIINMCLSTAFFLAFIVSSMSHYKHTDEYKKNFAIILSVFCSLVLIQTIFIIFYFFSNFLQNSKQNKNVLVKYFLVHFISFLYLTCVPIYLLATGLGYMCNLNTYLWNLFNNQNQEEDEIKRFNLFSIYFYFIYVISLVNFSSFVQLSSLFRTLLAFIFAVTFGLCSFIGIDDSLSKQNLNETLTSSSNTQLNFYTTLFLKGFLSENFASLLDLSLLILLIWFINRQSELIQRISFKCDQEALMKITHAKEQKELANWLIDIVIPAHVISHVKEKRQYSRNYDCVGVLFVSLCNFSEFFEESYEGGRELLRVLNEISIDFDRLFDEPKFKNVEKIKSIGSTFMIASGLSVDEGKSKKSNNSHLYELIDFALELNEKLESFNVEAMSVCHFRFQMKMGFNCGPVTAGVIGTDRLLYDIWGDTVNVASRMDSTGQAGFLQTPERVAKLLENDYVFHQRGIVQIKGKDQMMTYYMNPKENKNHYDNNNNNQN
ncbi:unnamed protein product [Brachionus calyciflorus]|uniref:Adenylate cyclase type 9 n=1 Tax=Brachionus calyciflorus TaxID=104777 RepID=A0A813ZK83_9BILA|nr:unnamed protein product [Brachionus calyciflorus]